MSTKKLQITTPIVTSVNGKSGDVTVPTSSGGFLCTITGSGTDSDPYVCDKSFDEIIQAVDDGFIPYCIHPRTIGDGGYGDKKLICIYLEYVRTRDNEYISFRSMLCASPAVGQTREIDIFSNGSVKLVEVEATDIPTITLKTWTSSDIT